jgi:hypothetical protein
MPNAETAPGPETFDYLVALNRFKPGANLFDAADNIRNPQRSADGPSVSDAERPLITAGVAWLNARFSGHTPAVTFAGMASWETGQKLLLPALGRMVIAPPVELRGQGPVTVEPQQVDVGDLLIIQGWFYQSPATATTGTVCHSSGQAMEVITALHGSGLVKDEPEDGPQRSEGSVGSYLLVARAARTGRATVAATFVRVTGAGVMMTCEVTVRD